ncbi:MAG TPA: glycosyltransferase family 39 protein [Terriglobales bacterium]|nr:glycosyltransferase family 39 protein [Terriglobales bacterium]
MRPLAALDPISQPKVPSPAGSRSVAGAPAYSPFLPLIILALGFLARLYFAYSLFLNPDEALIYFLSAQKSLAATYRASLLTAHPPLFYVLLYYWRLLGNSELMLRLPSVLAGTAFCWMAFKWLGRIAGSLTALVALVFFCFTPALVSLGAEVRQYSLLLLFLAACLYFLETALQENSAPAILVFSASLWLAILTQYSAWLFCLVVGIYALLRFARRPPPARVLGCWGAGQAIALAIYAVLYRTQLPWLLKMAQVDKVFQGEQSRVASIPRETFRLFHYLFSQPVVGSVVLLLFVLGIITVWRPPAVDDPAKPTGRQLAWLLFLPFVLSWAAALAGLYPFDGTRHSVVLALFVVAGATLGLTRYGRPGSWNMPVVAAVLLIACYMFAAPLGAYIKPRNQRRRLMAEAVAFLRQSTPPRRVFLLDDQSTYLFRYYFCRDQAAAFSEVPGQFRDYFCGGYRVAGSRQWMLTPAQLPLDLNRAARLYRLPPGQEVWIFQAGWNVNKEPELVSRLRDFGCPAPRRFGENLLACRLSPP